MVFGLLKKWRREAQAKRVLTALEAKVDALERTQGLAWRRDGPQPSSVDHITDAPLEAKELWVKQINQQKLTPFGRAALGAAFADFADQASGEPRRDPYVEVMSARGENFEYDPRVQRRFSGDRQLPRGRYHAVCDEQGNDGGTLVGELRAYYTPAGVGVVQMFDCTVPADLETVRRLEIPAGNTSQLVFMLPPMSERPHPCIASFFGPSGNEHGCGLALQIGLPLTVQKIRRERVLDLREPASALWLARTLSTLEWHVDTVRARCFPRRPPLDRFVDLLPELLVQENGGGGACMATGLLLWHLGADGLVFPSARNDAGIVIEGGQVAGHRGWNFVDYADTSRPEFLAWTENGNQWPAQIGFRPYPTAPDDATPIWFPEVTIVTSADGSWQVQGLRRRTNLRWRWQLLHYALHASPDELSESARETLLTLPHVLADRGRIDDSGILSMLVFEGVLGLAGTGEKLVALREHFAEFDDLAAAIDEVREKVYLPARERRAGIQSIYIPWQGADPS